MAILGEREKKVLLNTLKVRPEQIPAKQLAEYVVKYDNISMDDLGGVLPPQKLRDVEQMVKEANAQSELNRIKQLPANSKSEIEYVLGMFPPFYQQYEGLKVCEQACMYENGLKSKLRDIDIVIEQDDWSMLNKDDYEALRSFIRFHPNSVHKDEIDDLMWNIVNRMNTASEYEQYRNDWPYGRHKDEVESIIKFLEEWETVKQENDIFSVKYFLSQLPSNSSAYAEVKDFYENLRSEIIEDMRINPSNYPMDEVSRLIASGIFTKSELINENLTSERLWRILATLDRSVLPKLSDFQGRDSLPPQRDVCTDIYLFGTPGTGKTCLLMGLVGTNGKGFSLNMKMGAGDYAAALSEYVHLGFAPSATTREWIAAICGEVYEKTKSGKTITHNFNLVEMSGEQFAFGIVKNTKVDMASMGVGATDLLANKNRKCFFIVVDCSNDYITYSRMEKVRDEKTGEMITSKKTYLISQSTILAQLVNLFALPENKKIMDRVDAIHFVVTKADLLGDTQEERSRKARELLLREYGGAIQQLKVLCQRSKRINYATNYEPYLFTFSLGQFYLGNIYEFNPTDSIRIMNCIKLFSQGYVEPTWWDRFMEAIGD